LPKVKPLTGLSASIGGMWAESRLSGSIVEPLAAGAGTNGAGSPGSWVAGGGCGVLLPDVLSAGAAVASGVVTVPPSPAVGVGSGVFVGSTMGAAVGVGIAEGLGFGVALGVGPSPVPLWWLELKLGDGVGVAAGDGDACPGLEDGVLPPSARAVVPPAMTRAKATAPSIAAAAAPRRTSPRLDLVRASSVIDCCQSAVGRKS
jgi:hypothetical protein